ncbi:DUF2147 domain-containing protein [Shimia haliotis]|uniref:Uncharacterized conserved protein, DUF2147 family n=1 Tax=Shimia haliotis TaxID=1280847 RepID=A0A1I4A2U5_9RHOB|nr:DUF2147 domain-containing protein [Shimia haliotis]SFK50665.1 Uncharacterized conserved protein, DUF2147 family [Shimia haliotis]
MKKLILAAVMTVATAGIASADPILGMWKTEVDDGSYAHIDMKPCGAKICGTIAKTFNGDGEYQSPNIGKKLVIDMEAKGDGAYAGEVWRPSNDKIYIGKMQLNGNKIKLKGCVAGGLLCSSQNWTRL